MCFLLNQFSRPNSRLLPLFMAHSIKLEQIYVKWDTKTQVLDRSELVRLRRKYTEQSTHFAMALQHLSYPTSSEDKMIPLHQKGWLFLYFLQNPSEK